MNRIIAPLTLLLLWLGQFIHAQQAWGFEKCLQFALEHNLQLKAQGYQATIAKYQYWQSVFNYLPSVNAYAGHNLNSGRSVNPDNNAYINQNLENGYMGASIQLTVFNGLQSLAEVKKAGYQHLQSLEELEKVRLELTFTLINDYLNVLYRQEVVKVCTEQYELARENSIKTRILVDMGKLSYKDFLEIKAAEALDRENMLLSTTELITARLCLRQTMNNDQEVEVDPATTFGKPDSVFLLQPFDQLFVLAQSKLPYVRAAHWQLKSAQKDLAITYGKFSPMVSLGYTYESGYSQYAANPRNQGVAYAYPDQLRDKISNQFSVRVAIPIFDRFSRVNNISKARIEVKMAQNTVELTRQALYKDLQKRYTEGLNTWANYKTKRETLDAMTEIYHYAEERYQMGMLSALEYKLSKSSYNQATIECLKAKYELVAKIRILKLYAQE